MQIVNIHVFSIPSHLHHCKLQFDMKYAHICPLLSRFSIKICKKKKEKNLQNTLFRMRTVMRNKDILWSGLIL